MIGRNSALIIGLTLAIGGITVYALPKFSDSLLSTTSETVVVPEIKTVTALGYLEPDGEIISVSAPSTSQGNRVGELLVKEGEEIQKGQIIAVLDNQERLIAQLKQAEEQVKVAEANLIQVKAGAKTGAIEAQKAVIATLEAERINNIAAQTAMVLRMEAELNNAEVEYQRYEMLYNEGAISASQKDNKKLILETTRQQLAEAKANLSRISSAQQQQINQAKATLNQIAEVRPVDINVSQAKLKEAQSVVKIAQAELDNAYVKSPQAGTVIKILTRPGEIISSTEGIVKIGQINQMYAVAEVYQSDISKVQLGQKAIVTSGVIKGKLQGTVERIGLEVQRQEVVNTDPTANIDARVIEVRIKLEPESSQKVAGLTNLQVTVTLEIEK